MAITICQLPLWSQPELTSKPHKPCTKCGKPFSPNDFYTATHNGITKYKSICKECDNAGSKTRYPRRKKKCAYPDCERLISPTSTYCRSHFRQAPENKKRRGTIPLPTCAHLDCNRTLSKHTNKYCKDHYRLYPEYQENYRKGISSQATHDKMSVSAKRRANTPEGRKRMSKAASESGKLWKGRKHKESTKVIIREKRAKQVFSPESIKKHADALRGRPSKNKGIPATKATKDKISKTLLSKSDHLSKKAKERIARETDEQREKRLQPWIKAGHTLTNTSIERYIEDQLIQQGIEYLSQRRIGYYIVDFYIPEYNLVVEANGCHWHGCGLCGFNTSWHIEKREKDRIRTERLEEKGYIVKVFWEHEIRKAMEDENYILQLLD